MRASFVFGCRLREKIVDARLRRDRRRRQWIVARDHHGANAHRPKLRKAFFDSAFHDVFEIDHAEQPVVFGDDERRSAWR